VRPPVVDLGLVPEVVHGKAQEAGLRAHQAVGCHGLSRVDMRLSDGGELFVLEVNTIPGMTERSLLPMAARAAGMDFGELCCRIIEGAVASEAGKVKV
jgi:D-alanine-D-alanine ligase